MSKSDRIRQQQARARIAELRAAEARRRRRNRLIAIIGAVIVAAGAAAGITVAVAGGGAKPAAAATKDLRLTSLRSLGSLTSPPSAGPLGPEGVPIPHAAALTGTATKASGQPVDGIGCDTSEQTIFHIHAHLTIFVNGVPKQVPAGIGIPGAVAQDTQQGQFVSNGKCFYWLHTHAADGVIHIESPVHRTYTLGEFFDEWGQPLSSSQVGPVSGHITAIYNGQLVRGNPRDIPLTAHAQIQLEIGTPLVSPVTITWPSGL